MESLLSDLAKNIKAKVLQRSKKNYRPLGASATLILGHADTPLEKQVLASSSVLHLDKSHAAIHSYPETHPKIKYSSFRIDLALCTCGESMSAAFYHRFLEIFPCDVMFLEHKLRGFSHDGDGNIVASDDSFFALKQFSQTLDSKKFVSKSLSDAPKKLSFLKLRRKTMPEERMYFQQKKLASRARLAKRELLPVIDKVYKDLF